MDIAALKKTIADGEATLTEQKAQLAKARAEQKKAKIVELRETIKDFELTQFDLFDVKRPRQKSATKAVGVARYQSKDGLSKWTGKGRTPKWVETHVTAGGKKDDLLITA